MATPQFASALNLERPYQAQSDICTLLIFAWDNGDGWGCVPSDLLVETIKAAPLLSYAGNATSDSAGILSGGMSLTATTST